ncbi:hypothetical protein [Crucian carp herpesvirus]|uniref:Truncated ORF151A n=1 Tax=Cyprinid herpesvirus 2 TaxID=317878 RepID=A0A109QMK0_CYHV2|nr:truncated ORF151A [Cyprinid herpesvirus 2]APB93001.1 hypothetical protein [Crucian carp herpesvirus]QAU54871.1 truncated protein ORF151A [Cyprinid herpesvirus 2]QIM55326.1 hypothetical protein [Cyprinid herpesvirus 2]
MLLIAVLLTLSGLDAVRLIPLPTRLPTRRAITKPTIKKSLDELFVIATNDSEWLETDVALDPRVCPNKFGFYGTLLDGSFVIKCDYHVQMINMKYENNTEIMHIYDYKWPVHFNRSDYTEDIVQICDRCLPCKGRFDYQSPNGTCCQPCPAGFYAAEHCTVDGERSVCKRCPLDHYKDNSYVGTLQHEEVCRPLKTNATCPRNTHIRKRENRQSEDGYHRDNICDPNVGYYCPGIGIGQSCSHDAVLGTCPSGQYTFAHNTRENNAVCGHCNSDQYAKTNLDTGLTVCVNQVTCPNGTISTGGSKTTKATCSPQTSNWIVGRWL